MECEYPLATLHVASGYYFSHAHVRPATPRRDDPKHSGRQRGWLDCNGVCPAARRSAEHIITVAQWPYRNLAKNGVGIGKNRLEQRGSLDAASSGLRLGAREAQECRSRVRWSLPKGNQELATGCCSGWPISGRVPRHHAHQPGHRGTEPLLRRTGPPPCCCLEPSFSSRIVISRSRRSRHHGVRRVKRTCRLAGGAGWPVSPP